MEKRKIFYAKLEKLQKFVLKSSQVVKCPDGHRKLCDILYYKCKILQISLSPIGQFMKTAGVHGKCREMFLRKVGNSRNFLMNMYSCGCYVVE